MKDLYHSLKMGGHLLPVDLPEEYMKQIECNNWDLDYNGNILLNHFGGERNKLINMKETMTADIFQKKSLNIEMHNILYLYVLQIYTN